MTTAADEGLTEYIEEHVPDYRARVALYYEQQKSQRPPALVYTNSARAESDRLRRASIETFRASVRTMNEGRQLVYNE